MATVTVGELRNHFGKVLDRVAAGEHLTVTRYGKAVAELRPPVSQALTTPVLLDRRRQLPPVEIEAPAVRLDIDSTLDSER